MMVHYFFSVYDENGIGIPGLKPEWKSFKRIPGGASIEFGRPTFKDIGDGDYCWGWDCALGGDVIGTIYAGSNAPPDQRIQRVAATKEAGILLALGFTAWPDTPRASK